MELVGEFILQVFGEICCQIIVAMAADGFTGIAGFQYFSQWSDVSIGNWD